MLPFSLEELVDLTATLSLVFVLGSVYAHFCRRLHFPTLSQIALGLFFGLAAVLQMYRPFEPFEGLIIDLRNVPMVLAAAFLGWRGAVIALGCAVVARLGIGGVGMWAGVLGMSLAWGAGLIWKGLTHRMDRRGPLVILGLGAMVGLHIGGLLALPSAKALYFLTEIAVPLYCAQVIAVTIGGLMLEGERLRLRDEAKLERVAKADPQSGLMSIQTFQRDCAIRAAALADGSYRFGLVVQLRPWGALRHVLSRDTSQEVPAAVRLRLGQVLAGADRAAIFRARTLVFPLMQDELSDLDRVLRLAERAVWDQPFKFPGTPAVPVRTDMAVVELTNETDLTKTLEKMRFVSSRAVPKFTGTQPRPALATPDPMGHAGVDPLADRLFVKAALLARAENGPSQKSVVVRKAA